MVNCASCVEKACSRRNSCPVGEPLKKFAFREYRKAGNLKLYQKSSSLEVEGYMKYPRVKELIRLAEEMDWNKLGIAFCIGLSEEAKNCRRYWSRTGLKFIRLFAKLVALRRKNLIFQKEKIMHVIQFSKRWSSTRLARTLISSWGFAWGTM